MEHQSPLPARIPSGASTIVVALTIALAASGCGGKPVSNAD